MRTPPNRNRARRQVLLNRASRIGCLLPQSGDEVVKGSANTFCVRVILLALSTRRLDYADALFALLARRLNCAEAIFALRAISGAGNKWLVAPRHRLRLAALSG